jgi:serine/threonine-protein kinase
VNIEAYQNYLKGRHCFVRFTPESVAKAKECFEQALAIDPRYAPAYSGLALFYYVLASLTIRPISDVSPLAKSAAEKALAIDSANSESHSVLGMMAAIFDYDWKLAEEHFRKAMATEPSRPWCDFATPLAICFRWDEYLRRWNKTGWRWRPIPFPWFST